MCCRRPKEAFFPLFLITAEVFLSQSVKTPQRELKSMQSKKQKWRQNNFTAAYTFEMKGTCGVSQQPLQILIYLCLFHVSLPTACWTESRHEQFPGEASNHVSREVMLGHDHTKQSS